MKKKVITVRKGQKLFELIKEVMDDSKTVYGISIDKTLVNHKELEKKSKEFYLFKEDGYKFVVFNDEESDWYFIWILIDPNEDFVIFMEVNEMKDVIAGHYLWKDVYIRKWGSKAKIDEE